MSKPQKRKNLVAIVILFATSILAWYQFVPLFLPECKDPATYQHTIELSENIEKIWDMSPVFINANDQAIYMIANSQHLVFYGTTDSCQQNAKPINLNTNDGTILYTGTKIMPSGRIYDTTYEYSSDRFFLGYGSTGKINNNQNFTWNTGGIAAYEVGSGEILWSQPIPGTRDINSLVASNSTISIDGGSRSDDYYLLDTQTGEIISTLAKSTHGLPMPGANVNMAYWYDNESNPQAPDVVNIATWAKKFEQIFQPPILTEHAILIRREPGKKPGSVASLDKNSGEIIWETPNNVISNVATNGVAAFFLTSSAKLIVLDIETGEEIGFVNFSNADFAPDRTQSYFVAANENQVFVFLGDSNQLFAFHLID